jgi:hypothetical protein
MSTVQDKRQIVQMLLESEMASWAVTPLVSRGPTNSLRPLMSVWKTRMRTRAHTLHFALSHHARAQ